MAIYRPKTIDDAPARGLERSGGRQRGDFLVSRGMGVSPGEESRSAALRSGDRGAAALRPDQAIKRPRGPCAERHPQEKSWRISVVLRKMSLRSGEETETDAKEWAESIALNNRDEMPVRCVGRARKVRRQEPSVRGRPQYPAVYHAARSTPRLRAMSLDRQTHPCSALAERPD